MDTDLSRPLLSTPAANTRPLPSCPLSESLAIWFPSLVEGTNSQLTERTKKMNSENIKKVANQAIEQLVAALNQGRSETLTQYLAAIGRFHHYSLRNVMLIASQKPTATHVAGFHAWHELGRFVKKGEKGILILAPIVRRKNESKEEKETDESSTAVGFRAAYVFDRLSRDLRTSPARPMDSACATLDSPSIKLRTNFIPLESPPTDRATPVVPLRGAPLPPNFRNQSMCRCAADRCRR